jgi:hypothetical protein
MSVGKFTVSATWPSPPKVGGRDVAELRLNADGAPLTRLLDLERKEERDYVRSSAVSLALWFADNWWRLRHESLKDGLPTPEWRLRHELTSASGGTLWPPIMIHSTGDRVLVTPTYGRPTDVGAVRHLLPKVTSVRGQAFEAGLDAFFEQVLGKCASALDGAALSQVVKELAVERGDQDTAAWRRLEARLGFDPGVAPDGLMNALVKLEKTVGETGLDEAATAAPGRRAAETLGRAIEAARESGLAIDPEIVRNLPRDRIRTEAAPPWLLGKDAAYQVREADGVPDGPIRNKRFAELLKVPVEDLRKPATARGLPYAARLRAKGQRHRVALQSGELRNRRFELACVLGDLVWDTSDFGVVSPAKTDRQKFQRAFAQNLLTPYRDVKKIVDPEAPTSEQMLAAARHFHVHPNVIQRLLILEGVLPKETFEQRLEAA